jgi:hypothetical protein
MEAKKAKKVFVLVHSNGDYTYVEVYEKKERAIEALKELAEKYGMDLYGTSADGNDNYAEVEEKTLFR